MDLFSELIRTRPMLEPALEYADGSHLWDDIVAGVYSGAYQLWANETSAIITEVITYPRKRTVNYFLVGGVMEGLEDLRPQVETWATDQGYDSICMHGRKGWLRSFLKDEGYTEKWVVMSKELDHG